jgi:phage gp36-like protein
MSFPYGFVADDLLERFSEERLVQITDVTNNPPSTRDDAAIEKAANDAAGELDMAAGRYYVTPLDPLTGGLRMVLLDLWAWRLLFNCKPDWLESEQKGDGFSWSDRRKELMAWLKGLSSPKRETVLPGVAEIAERTSASGIVFQAGTPVMTKTNLWKVP